MLRTLTPMQPLTDEHHLTVDGHPPPPPPHHHQHHDHNHHQGIFPNVPIPQDAQLPLPLPQLPAMPQADELVKKLREMIEGDQLNENDRNDVRGLPNTPANFRAYPSESVPPPQYQPQPQYRPEYQSHYQSHYQPQYQPQHPSQYAPKYQPAYSTPTCGSNLLVSCTPQVQTVPCYPPSPYNPPSYRPSSYSPPISYSPSYQPPNSPAYVDTPASAAVADVHSKPGPPYYPEPYLQSIKTPTMSQDQPQNIPKPKDDASSSQQKDSKPEPSHISKQTNEEDINDQVINVVTTEQPTTLKPSTFDQVRKLSEKIENHVESLEKFKEIARKKLREAIDRSNDETLTSELENIQHFLNVSPQHMKPSSMRQMIKHHDSSNSVW